MSPNDQDNVVRLDVLVLERKLLGGLIERPEHYPAVAKLLTAESFLSRDHGAIFDAVAKCIGAEPGAHYIRVDKVVAVLRQSRRLNAVGGVESINRMIDLVTRDGADVLTCASELARIASQRQAHAFNVQAAQALERGDVEQAAAHTAKALNAVTRSEVWDEPVPLDAPVVPPWPQGVLHGVFGRFAQELARATQTPLDLPAMLTLGAISAAVGGKFAVQVKPGYQEPVHVFLAVALPPASRKSECFRHITHPLADHEREERVRREAARKQEEARQDAIVEGEKATQEEEPRPFRLYAGDATPEYLEQELAAQNGRLAVLSAEGGDLFEMMAGRYRGGEAPNLGVYLAGHAGDRLLVGRVKRGVSDVERPALTVAIATQPSTLRTLSKRPELRARGLVARFLFGVPASNLGTRDVDAPAMEPLTRGEYHRALTRLLALTPDEPESEAEAPRPRVLRLSREAFELYREFARRTEARLGATGDLAPVPEWAGKLVGAAMRITGLLHLADLAGHDAPWEVPIEHDTLERAIHLAEEYFVPHARLAFDIMTSTEATEGAKRLCDWIQRHKRAEFSARDAHRALQGKGTRELVTDPALEVLVTHGYIRLIETESAYSPKGGRPRGGRYHAHPRLL